MNTKKRIHPKNEIDYSTMKLVKWNSYTLISLLNGLDSDEQKISVDKKFYFLF